MNPGKIDIHNRDRIRRGAEELLNSGICKENKDFILRFVEYKKGESNISVLRQAKILGTLRVCAEFLKKPFDKADKNDIERIINKIYEMPGRGNNGQICDSTKNTYCKILKLFYKWLRKSEHPEETDWLKPPRYKPKKLTTQDKLFWEDVVKLSRASMNKRDFLLPQILFDCGGRIGELLNLRLNDIELIEVKGENENAKPRFIARLNIRVSKTEPRQVEIYKSVGALKDWLDNHPLRNDREAPLFVNLEQNHNSMKYRNVRQLLVKLKERSGIKKPVNPHSFRKSACSHCGDIGMGDSQIDLRFGWEIGSSVKRHYLFPEQKKSNKAYLKGEGAVIEEDTEKKKEPETRLCWYCNQIIPIGRDFCVNPKCRMPVNPEKAIVRDREEMKSVISEILQEFMKSPDIEKQFEKHLKEKGLGITIQ